MWNTPGEKDTWRTPIGRRCMSPPCALVYPYQSSAYICSSSIFSIFESISLSSVHWHWWTKRPMERAAQVPLLQPSKAWKVSLQNLCLEWRTHTLPASILSLRRSQWAKTAGVSCDCPANSQVDTAYLNDAMRRHGSHVPLITKTSTAAKDLKSGICERSIRKRCIICGVKSNVMCRACNVFVCIEGNGISTSCWDISHS